MRASVLEQKTLRRKTTSKIAIHNRSRQDAWRPGKRWCVHNRMTEMKTPDMPSMKTPHNLIRNLHTSRASPPLEIFHIKLSMLHSPAVPNGRLVKDFRTNHHTMQTHATNLLATHTMQKALKSPAALVGAWPKLPDKKEPTKYVSHITHCQVTMVFRYADTPRRLI